MQLILAEDETVLMVQEVAERLIRQRKVMRTLDTNDQERVLLETNTERKLQEEHRMLATQLKELRRVRADIDRKLKDLDQMESSLFASATGTKTQKAGKNPSKPRASGAQDPSKRSRNGAERGSHRRNGGDESVSTPYQSNSLSSSMRSTASEFREAASNSRTAELDREVLRREEATRQRLSGAHRQSTPRNPAPSLPPPAESEEDMALRRREEMTRKKLIELRAQLAGPGDSRNAPAPKATPSVYDEYLTSSRSAREIGGAGPAAPSHARPARHDGAGPTQRSQADRAPATTTRAGMHGTRRGLDNTRQTNEPSTVAAPSRTVGQPSGQVSQSKTAHIKPSSKNPKRETDESEKRFLNAFERQRDRIARIRQSIAAAVVIQRAWRAHKARKK